MVQKTTSVLRQQGRVIKYTYDGFNRMVEIDYPFSQDVSLTYGQPGSTDNTAGRLLSRTDQSGTVSFSYGLLGEQTGKTQTLNRMALNAEEKTVSFSYTSDYLGRMQEIIYPTGEIVRYGYDEGGQVTSVTGERNSLVTEYVQDIGYDEYGQRVYIKYGNGVETEYSYDPERRWLESVHTVKGLEKYQDMNYSFDSVGNVTQMTNEAGRYSTTQNYGYDGLYQLTSAEGNYTSKPHGYTEYTGTYRQQFSYDTLGNIISKISNSSVNPSQSQAIGAQLNYSLDYSYYENAPNQAEIIGNSYYQYDANGNLIMEREGGHGNIETGSAYGVQELEDGVNATGYGWGLDRSEEADKDDVYQRTYRWNEENRLMAVESPEALTEFRYNADGERTHKKSGTFEETLYFDSMFSATTDIDVSDLRLSLHIYLGETRIATRLKMEDSFDYDTVYEQYNTYYYHSDHLGSAQLVTDYEGEEYEHIEYTPGCMPEQVPKAPARALWRAMD
ncbi:RHS repeat domain-containing protein [Salinispira pacifica]|uniref:YD repeat protein n=1 Tax=Salinispira pacifica TaxID=1307761 RepID=V5WJG8_9SPIO|nr:RHS repeat protein [Salinispira pacifica]AHC15311.1 YD repeat protein [Salinispira pacifica]